MQKSVMSASKAFSVRTRHILWEQEGMSKQVQDCKIYFHGFKEGKVQRDSQCAELIPFFTDFRISNTYYRFQQRCLLLVDTPVQSYKEEGSMHP